MFILATLFFAARRREAGSISVIHLAPFTVAASYSAAVIYFSIGMARHG